MPFSLSFYKAARWVKLSNFSRTPISTVVREIAEQII